MNKPSHAFDLSRFAASASGLTPTIQVRVPQTAFQIHPDRERTASGIYLCHVEGKWWMVAADVVEDEGIEIQNLWRADLYEGRKPDGQRFVLPVTLPMYADKTDWYDSLSQAARLARKKWITVKVSDSCCPSHFPCTPTKRTGMTESPRVSWRPVGLSQADTAA